MTLVEKAIRVARGVSVGSVNPKAFISDVLVELERSGDVARGESGNFKRWLVEMHRRGELSLCRCDLVPAYSLEKVRLSEVRHLGAEFHFIRC